MKKQNLQKQYKDDFNDKYTTSVTVDDILKDINLEETIDERKGFKDFYQRNVRRLVKRLVLLFSCVLVVMISLTVVIMNDGDEVMDIHYEISDILTRDEEEILLSNGQYEDENINLISSNSNFKFFFMKSAQYLDNKFTYNYFYKVLFESSEDELVLKINNKEFVINQDNCFGEFYTVVVPKGEIANLEFCLEYQGEVRNYSFDD